MHLDTALSKPHNLKVTASAYSIKAHLSTQNPAPALSSRGRVQVKITRKLGRCSLDSRLESRRSKADHRADLIP